LLNQVQIFDAMGRKVLEKQGGQNGIDVASLAKGLYRVRISTRTGEIFTGSFSKQ
jgi:hypothetical protein